RASMCAPERPAYGSREPGPGPGLPGRPRPMDTNGPSIGKPESSGPSHQTGRAKRARRPPKEGSMMARDRRYRKTRPATLKTRAGIAAAVLAGGGAIGAAALLATSHPAAPTASPAAYANRL